MALAGSSARADEKSERRRAQLLEQMVAIAHQTKVSYASGNGAPNLAANPVFRYDDQPRRFIDATMWVWTDGGRPVAFEKVEAVYHVEQGIAQWGHCFTSASNELLTAEWEGGRTFRSKEPGVPLRPLSDAPPPAPRRGERKRQARELARRFSARILTDPGNNVTEEMRLLATPLYEFSEASTNMPAGAVFGFSTSGTNPDLLVLLEVRDDRGMPRWHYAPVRMTSGGVTLKYGGAQVWDVPWVNWNEVPFPTWTFFHTPRTPVPDE